MIKTKNQINQSNYPVNHTKGYNQKYSGELTRISHINTFIEVKFHSICSTKYKAKSFIIHRIFCRKHTILPPDLSLTPHADPYHFLFLASYQKYHLSYLWNLAHIFIITSLILSSDPSGMICSYPRMQTCIKTSTSQPLYKSFINYYRQSARL